MQIDLQLSNTELQMMNEVFEVMNKYKSQTREFGLQLVHQHFPISDDEVLYETHDTTERVLSVSTKKINELKKTPLATAWQKNHTGICVSMLCCDSDVGDNDSGNW